jgi:hypothetical protein
VIPSHVRFSGLIIATQYNKGGGVDNEYFNINKAKDIFEIVYLYLQKI